MCTALQDVGTENKHDNSLLSAFCKMLFIGKGTAKFTQNLVGVCQPTTTRRVEDCAKTPRRILECNSERRNARDVTSAI